MTDMSITDLTDMYIFVEVAGSRTLTAAASSLNMPLSSLSRRIGAFERRVGLALIDRSTRRLKLTEAGENHFQRSRSVISDARSAYHSLKQENEASRGLVTLAVLSDGALIAVSHALAAFSHAHDDVKVAVQWIESADQLEGAQADCAVHYGQGRAQTYICRSIRSLPFVLVGHPRLVASLKPDRGDTWTERLITCERNSTLIMEHRESRHTRTFSFLDTLIVEHQSTVLSATLAGLGLAVLPYEVVSRYLSCGALAEVDDSFEPRSSELFVTYKSRLLPLRARLLIDWLCKFDYSKHSFEVPEVKGLVPRADAMVVASA